MQMCSRLIYEQAIRTPKRDRGEERDSLMAAIYKLYAALHEAGYAP